MFFELVRFAKQNWKVFFNTLKNRTINYLSYFFWNGHMFL